MVFILLYFPCIASIVAIRKESGSWKWAIIAAVYTIVLAWVAAFITFRIFSLIL
jgi:ferrous iron transport protein B